MMISTSSSTGFKDTARRFAAQRRSIAAFGALALAGLAAQPAHATQYTYTFPTTSGQTVLWSTGTNWSPGAPVSNAATQLTFSSNSTTFASGYTSTSQNNVASPFQLNILDLNGTGPSSGTTATVLSISGSQLGLVSNGSATPVINLNANSGTTAGLTYSIVNALALSNDTLFTGNGTATFSFANPISGAVNVTKTGTSTLTLTALNTFGGAGQGFNFTDGIISFSKNTALGAAATTLNIGDISTAQTVTGGLQIKNTLSGNVLANTTVNINRDATFNGSQTFTLGGATSGSVITLGGSGTRTLTANQSSNNAVTFGTAGSTLNGGGVSTLALVGTTSAGIAANIADGFVPLSLTLSPANTRVVSISGTNAYTGGTIIGDVGIVNINSDSALGTVPGAAATNLTFSANGTLQQTANGTVSLSTNRSIAIGSGVTAKLDANGGTFTINGGISGGSANSALTKNGTGTVVLAGSNMYAGQTTISTGTLQVGNGGTTGTLGTGNTTVSSGTSLVFNRSNSYTYGGVLSAGGSVTQAGTGTTTLTGVNTYTGGTTISAGELRLDNATNSGTGTGAVNIIAGVLSGTGRAAGLVTVTNGAVLAPGDNAASNFGTVGSLGVGTTSGATLTNAALDFDFSSSALSGNDLLTTGGTLGLGTLSFTFNELSGTLDTTNPYTLISGAGSVTGFNAGGYTTTFLGGINYTPTYSLNGSTLQVSFAPIVVAPEPSAWVGMFVGALGLGGLSLRARRRVVA